MNSTSKPSHCHLVTYVPIITDDYGQQLDSSTNICRFGSGGKVRYIPIPEGVRFRSESDERSGDEPLGIPNVKYLTLKNEKAVTDNTRIDSESDAGEQPSEVRFISIEQEDTNYTPRKNKFVNSLTNTPVLSEIPYDYFQEIPKVKAFNAEWKELWKLKERVGWMNTEYTELLEERERIIRKRQRVGRETCKLLQVRLMKEKITQEDYENALITAKGRLDEALDAQMHLEKKINDLRNDVQLIKEKLKTFPRAKQKANDLVTSLEMEKKDILLRSKKLDRIIKKLIENNQKVHKVVQICHERYDVMEKREMMLEKQLEEIAKLKESFTQTLEESPFYGGSSSTIQKTFEASKKKIERKIYKANQRGLLLNKNLQDLKLQISLKESAIHSERMPILDVQSEIERCLGKLKTIKDSLSILYQTDKSLLKRMQTTNAHQKLADLQGQIFTVRRHNQKLRTQIGDVHYQVYQLQEARETIQELDNKKLSLKKRMTEVKRKKRILGEEIKRLNVKVAENRPQTGHIESPTVVPILKERRKNSAATDKKKNYVSFSGVDKRNSTRDSLLELIQMLKPHFSRTLPIPYSTYSKQTGKNEHDLSVSLQREYAEKVNKLRQQLYMDARKRYGDNSASLEPVTPAHKNRVAPIRCWNPYKKSTMASNSSLFGDSQASLVIEEINTQRDMMLKSTVPPRRPGSSSLGVADGWRSLVSLFGSKPNKPTITNGDNPTPKFASAPETSNSVCREANHRLALPSILAVPSFASNDSNDMSRSLMLASHNETPFQKLSTPTRQKESITQTVEPFTVECASFRHTLSPLTKFFKQSYWPIFSSLFSKNFFSGQLDKKALTSADNACQTSSCQIVEGSTLSDSIKAIQNTQPSDSCLKYSQVQDDTPQLPNPLCISTQTSCMLPQSVDNESNSQKLSELTPLTTSPGTINTLPHKYSSEFEKYVILPQNIFSKSEDLLNAEILHEKARMSVNASDSIIAETRNCTDNL